MPGLIHLVSLQMPAGVELQFAEFVRAAASRYPEWSHVLMNPAGPMHPLVRSHAGSALAAEFLTKYRGRLRLPAVPRFVRAHYSRQMLRRHDARALIIWNRSARVQFALDAAGSTPSIHYEHGAAWFSGHETDRRRYFERVQLCVANSRAAARVLQEFWSYRGDIVVCRNAMRPGLEPTGPVAKQFPLNRRIRIGVAARLFPVKGVAIALHALKRIRELHVDAELHIAGYGPEFERLQSLAHSLGLESVVEFHGVVDDMASFYKRIDCLLHTPLSEAFGLVALEATAHGCPVIVAAVDGLPEAVKHQTSGICIPVELSLDDYVDLGGDVSGLPKVTYDPGVDQLRNIGIVSPDSAAQRIVELFSDAHEFERFSRSAAHYAAAEFPFDRYVDEVMEVIQRVAAP